MSLPKSNEQTSFTSKQECSLAKHFDYIAMEYCKHGDLFDLIKRSGKISESLSKYLFTQVLNGVEFLHSKEGVAHLDLKLENILIGDNL